MILLMIILIPICISDIKEKRIPNVLVALIFAWGSVYAVCNNGVFTYVSLIIRSLFFIGIFWYFFASGKLGAGDIKLMAATGLFFTGERFLFFILWTFIAGLVCVPLKRFLEKEKRIGFIKMSLPVFAAVTMGSMGLY
ncbi:MAG: prepilin peptidase [Lachnospiraceae bacterium]|jgi:prepilin peptidase CpaA|nr:prepilin peptidase [Lachnospiraceae bacterium]